MSHSQFHCTGRVYLDLHGLIFETSICYWQDQPGSLRVGEGVGAARAAARTVCSPTPETHTRRRGGVRGFILERASQERRTCDQTTVPASMS